MRSPIDALDNGVRRCLQFVLQAAFNQPAQNWITKLLPVDGKAGDINVAPCSGHGAVHRLDDVAANGQLPQNLLELGLQAPASRCNLVSKAKPLKLCGPSNHEPPKFRVSLFNSGAK